MNRSRRTASSPTSRTRRRAVLGVLATTLTLIVGLAAPAGHTGAWFTAQQSRGSNSVAAASLEPVSGLSATARDDGVNVRWVSAQQQTWATANRVSSGATYTVARTIDGKNPTTIYSGVGTSTSDAYPLARDTQTQTTFSVGANVAGAISDGSLYTWGAGYDYGLLGTNTTLNKYPTKVTFPGNRSIIDFSYNAISAAAVASDGTVWIWGNGTNSQTPKQVAAPTSPRVISATTNGYVINMLDASGVVWTSHVGQTPTAVNFPNGRRIVQLSKTSMVLASDGTVWSIGGFDSNDYGQLANGTFKASADPVQAILPPNTSAVKIASSSDNTAVLLNDNSIWVAGSNKRGQLGAALPSGSKTNSYAYFQKFQVPAGKTWTNVSVGNDIVGAVASDGTAYVAGFGVYGQLGNGSAADSDVPVKTYNPDGVRYKTLELGTTGVQGYAVDQNGNFWGWGASNPSNPVFGNGDGQYSTYPYPIVAATGLKYQSGGATFKTCANGNTPNSAGYCPFVGTVGYTVSYQYFSWSAASSDVSATATPTQTGVAVLGGPGGSGMCLTIQGNGSADGTPVILARCDSSATGQKWATWSDGTFRANGKCLDMKGNTSGSIVQLWGCNGLGFQWWVPRDDGSMYNPSSGLCLADPSGTAAAGTQQQIATCNGSTSQRWKLL